MEISKEQMLTGVLVAMIVLSFYQTIQLKDLSGKINGDGAATAATAGETVEQMNERMHGSGSGSSSGAPAPASSADAGSGMVGGC